MVKVSKEVDHILLHGVDLASTLELEVGQIGLIEINPYNSACIQYIILSPVALPPAVGHQHGKPDKHRSPFLVYGECAGTGGQEENCKWLCVENQK
jgi:hypothetical protein